MDIIAHWAIESPFGGSYDITDFSPGPLAKKDFEDIRTRLKSGTVTMRDDPKIGFCCYVGGVRSSRWLCMALEQAVGPDDGSRAVNRSQIICVPWEQVVERRLSYVALREAFEGHSLPPEAHGPAHLWAAGYDYDRIAGRVDDTVRAAAALLLSGGRVCVVRSGDLSETRRIEFLDAVAALLPFGLRADLSVATWAKSNTEHGIRLSFAENAPLGAFELRWNAGGHARMAGSTADAIPAEARRYELELRTFTGDRLVALLQRLAAHPDPLMLGHPTSLEVAFSLIREQPAVPYRGPVGGPVDGPVGPVPEEEPPIRRPEAGAVHPLRRALDSLAARDRARLGDAVEDLRSLVERGKVADADRDACRFAVQGYEWPRELGDALHWNVTREFSALLVDLVLPQPAKAGEVDEFLNELGSENELREPCLAALEGLLHSRRLTYGAKLLVAVYRNAPELGALLWHKRAEELLHTVAEAESHKILKVVLGELESNPDPAIARKLRQYGYLVKAVEAGPRGAERIGHYQRILRLACGPNPSARRLGEILEDFDRVPDAFFLAAVAERIPGSEPVLYEKMVTNLVRLQTRAAGDPLAREIARALEATRARPQLPDGRRRRRRVKRVQGPEESTVNQYLMLILVSSVAALALVAALAVTLLLRF